MSVRIYLRLLALLGVVVLVYASGLTGPFLFDDYPNIVRNRFLYLEALDFTSLADAALSGQSGPSGRVLAMLSFALNGYAFGWSPMGFKVVNLVIHLANGLLVYGLALCIFRQLDRRCRVDSFEGDTGHARLAWVVAAIWLLHPIHLTTVLLVVQRMTSLSAMSVLAALLIYVRLRPTAKTETQLLGLLVVLIVGAAVGLLSKENAVLVVPLGALVEYTLFSRDALTARARYVLNLGFLVIVGGPLCFVVIATIVNPELVLASYVIRDFTVSERVLTQARILFHYLSLMGFPEIGRFCLYNDDFGVSRGLMSPPTTLVALGGWLVVIWVSWRLRTRLPLLAFSVGWYLCAHALESSVIGLELIFEHRNYVAFLGPLLAAVWYAHRGLSAVASKWVRTFAVAVIIVATGGSTLALAKAWSSAESLEDFILTHRPDSPRGNTLAALRTGVPMDQAWPRLARAVELDRRNILTSIEVIKILAELAGLAAKGAPANGWPEAVPRSPEAIEALLERYDGELRARLRARPVHGETVSALKKLTQCILAGYPVCIGVADRALVWHNDALANTRLLAIMRKSLQMSLARLYVWRGELLRALPLARHAAEGNHVATVDFGLRLVELYVLLEDWVSADRELSRLEEHVSNRLFRASDVRAARKRFAQTRREKG